MTPILNREKLRAAREEKALTQEKLAEFSGLSDRHIRTLETKKVDTSASVLYRVSRVLGKPMDDFMTVVPDEGETDGGQADTENRELESR